MAGLDWVCAYIALGSVTPRFAQWNSAAVTETSMIRSLDHRSSAMRGLTDQHVIMPQTVHRNNYSVLSFKPITKPSVHRSSVLARPSLEVRRDLPRSLSPNSTPGNLGLRPWIRSWAVKRSVCTRIRLCNIADHSQIHPMMGCKSLASRARLGVRTKPSCVLTPDSASAFSSLKPLGASSGTNSPLQATFTTSKVATIKGS